MCNLDPHSVNTETEFMVLISSVPQSAIGVYNTSGIRGTAMISPSEMFGEELLRQPSLLRNPSFPLLYVDVVLQMFTRHGTQNLRKRQAITTNFKHKTSQLSIDPKRNTSNVQLNIIPRLVI